MRIERFGIQDIEDKAQAAGVGRAFGNKDSTTVGLNFGYYGGQVLADGVLTTVVDGVVALTLSQVNYVERTPAGVVSANAVEFSADRIPLYEITTNATQIGRASCRERVCNDV